MKKAQDFDITVHNIAVSVVGKNKEFQILTREELGLFVDDNKMDVA
jgi:hypothetical protein